MAALVVTANIAAEVASKGIHTFGPLKVAAAVETDLSTPNTAIVIPTRGFSMMALQLIFANYTGVTVKAQRSLDGVNFSDIVGATTSTSGGVVVFDPQAPYVRLSIAATLSASADSLDVWVYGEMMK